MYAEKDTNYLHVKTINNDGKELYDLNLTKQGYPFDIISVGWGWVALIKDFKNPNYLYLLSVDTNNKTVFTRTLINSNNNPTSASSDQLIFYQNSTTPAFGMHAMFNPSSGKLALGKNRLAVIFAHYNFFGYSSDGTREDHTGDTLVTFDLTGKDDKIAATWGASHSLVENLVYTGEKFISASLSDAYPQNILLQSTDGINSIGTDPKTGLKNILDYEENPSFLPDVIPGNGQGFSNGRLGNLVQLADGETFVLSYARRKSWAVFNGQNVSSNVSEVGLSFFDKNLNVIGEVNLGDGQLVNQIQSCRYGKNIFVSYVISNKHLVGNQEFLDPNLNNDDIQYFLLLDESGNVISGPLLYGSFFTNLPASDEMRMMADGRCAWTNVDKNGILSYLYLPAPTQTPTNYNDVKGSQFYNGGNFYLINSYDLKKYRMATVDSASSTYLNLVDLGLTKLSLISSVMKEKYEI